MGCNELGTSVWHSVADGGCKVTSDKEGARDVSVAILAQEQYRFK